jgi:hypothetical protein
MKKGGELKQEHEYKNYKEFIIIISILVLVIKHALD